jgi:hypothetical protein
MQEEQSALSLLASLLRQLVTQDHASSHYMQTQLQKGKDQKRQPLFNEVASMLQYVAGSYREVFIVVDALDECATTERSELLSQLSLLQEQLSAVRVMITFRPPVTPEERFSRVVELEISAHAEDLRRFICGQKKKLSKVVGQNPGLMDDVVRGIVRGSDGMLVLPYIV